MHENKQHGLTGSLGCWIKPSQNKKTVHRWGYLLKRTHVWFSHIQRLRSYRDRDERNAWFLWLSNRATVVMGGKSDQLGWVKRDLKVSGVNSVSPQVIPMCSLCQEELRGSLTSQVGLPSGESSCLLSQCWRQENNNWAKRFSGFVLSPLIALAVTQHPYMHPLCDVLFESSHRPVEAQTHIYMTFHNVHGSLTRSRTNPEATLRS